MKMLKNHFLWIGLFFMLLIPAIWAIQALAAGSVTHNTSSDSSWVSVIGAIGTTPEGVFWSGQNGVGIKAVGNRRFTISTNDVHNLRMEGNGDIVVGPKADDGSAPAPDSVFEVDGMATANEYAFQDDTNTLIENPSSDTMGFKTGGSERMRLTDDGKLGIGLTSPAQELHVSSSDSATRFLMTNATIGETSSDGLLFEIENPGAKITNNENSYLRFGTNGSERVRIDSSGNVGIGTTSPGRLLHLEGSTAAGFKVKNTGDNDVIIEMDANMSAANQDLGRIDGYWNGNRVAQIKFRSGDDTTAKDDGYITFSTSSDSSTTSERMRIDKNGNVGIATTGPTEKLDVTGNIHATGTIKADSVDPAFVLYDYETHDSIIEKTLRDVPGPKLSGAIMFFNGEANRIEVYVPAQGRFFDLMGNLLATVTPITETYEYEYRYYLHPIDGEVVKYEARKYQDRYEVKEGYDFDSKTGKFYDLEGVEVPKEEAIYNAAVVTSDPALSEETQVSQAETPFVRYAAFGIGNSN